MDNWHGYEPLQVAPAGNSLSVLIISFLEQFLGLSHDHSNIFGFTWLFIWIMGCLSSAVSFLHLLTAKSCVCVCALLDAILCISLLLTLSSLHSLQWISLYSWSLWSSISLDSRQQVLPSCLPYLYCSAGTSFASSCALFSISIARVEHTW